MKSKEPTKDQIFVGKWISFIAFFFLAGILTLPNEIPGLWVIKIIWLTSCIGAYITLLTSVRIKSWIDIALILMGPITLSMVGVEGIRFWWNGPPSE